MEVGVKATPGANADHFSRRGDLLVPVMGHKQRFNTCKALLISCSRDVSPPRSG